MTKVNSKPFILKDLGKQPRGKSGNTYHMVLCECYECHKSFEAIYGNVYNKATALCSDCGHIQGGKKIRGLKSRNKGMYNSWRAMRTRCNNPNADDYSYYGGRGIAYPPEWDNPDVFEKWALANGWAKGLTIERKKVNLNYSPENCYWATRLEQVHNRRINKNNTTGAVGVQKLPSGNYRFSINGEHIKGTYKTIKDAMKARNEYIIKNNLPNKLAFPKEET